MDEINIKNAHFIEITTIRDGYDGVISVADELKSIPFAIKRVYYIYNLINHAFVMRGKHAHKKLEQVIFCINGSCHISLNDGANKKDIELTQPQRGIYIGPRVWHVMDNFCNNCILLVFASDYFEEADYIRGFDDFLHYIDSPPQK